MLDGSGCILPDFALLITRNAVVILSRIQALNGFEDTLIPTSLIELSFTPKDSNSVNPDLPPKDLLHLLDDGGL